MDDSLDDSQLDKEQRAPSAGPVQYPQVIFHLVPVERAQRVDAFLAQTGGRAAAADFFAVVNNDAVPVARTQSVDAFSSLTDRGRAAASDFLAAVNDDAKNKEKVAAVAPFSNYSLPPTPEADAVSVEVIFRVSFFYNKL
jgi:hypothetical protein